MEKEIAKYIDHTLLKADATGKDIKKLCDEAKKYGFFSVCVNPCYVAFAKKLLHGSGVKVCTVAGFPLGAVTPKVKAFDARESAANGADEIDMVINIGALKNGRFREVLVDMIAVRKAVPKKTLKMIIETALLTDKEKIKACRLAEIAGADFIKTSTGFAKSGASVRDIKLIRKNLNERIGIKASGGIKTFKDAVAMIKSGASRLGTSSSLSIIRGK